MQRKTEIKMSVLRTTMTVEKQMKVMSEPVASANGV